MLLRTQKYSSPAGTHSDLNSVKNMQRKKGSMQEWNGMEWNGMQCNAMEWNGMEWNEMDSCQHNHMYRAKHEEVKKLCFQDANLCFVDVGLEDLHGRSSLWEPGACCPHGLAAKAPQ